MVFLVKIVTERDKVKFFNSIEYEVLLRVQFSKTIPLYGCKTIIVVCFISSTYVYNVLKIIKIFFPKNYGLKQLPKFLILDIYLKKDFINILKRATNL